MTKNNCFSMGNSGRVGQFNQFRPDFRPVLTKLLPLDGAPAFALNSDADFGGQLGVAIAEIHKVTDGRSDFFGKVLAPTPVKLEKEDFELHAPLHQIMNDMSTSLNDGGVPISGRMSLKLIRITRLKQFFTQRSVEELSSRAKAIGKKPNQTSDLLTGKASFGEKVARSIEEHAGLPPGWLDHIGDQVEKPNIELAPVSRAVPLVSWAKAGEWCGIVDALQVFDQTEWLPCPVLHGPRTYALTVRGVSMYNPMGKPSFQDGDTIFVDPDRQADHRSLIIARLDDEKEATFKQLLIEDGRRMLQALNPSWPNRIIPINGNCSISGVVIGKVESFI